MSVDLGEDTMPRRKPGRPMKRKPPEPIPDTPENVMKSLLRTRTKAQRARLKGRENE